MEQLEKRLQRLQDRLRSLEDHFELMHAREQKGLLFEAVARFVRGNLQISFRRLSDDIPARTCRLVTPQRPSG